MKLDGTDSKRLAIYFFYDPQGVVDDYVIHMLSALSPHVTDTLVVCNGMLTPEGRAKLLALENLELLVRENTGFDVWAYKAAMDHKGWAALSEYDEIILQNFTVMGPVNSLADMFSEMDSRDLDFWGVTVHNGAPFDPWGGMPDGKIPLHIQSHFIAVRRPMLTSYEFQHYWDTMIPITSYIDAVSKHEALFTKRFADMGYRWSAYVDTSDMADRIFYPLFNEPVELIENRRCPIFKRKSFFAGPSAYLEENSNRPARELYDYLRRDERFADDLLVPHLLRSCHQGDLQSSLNLHEVLSTTRGPHGSSLLKVGVVASVGSVQEARTLLPRLRYVGQADITLVTGEEPGVAEGIRTLLVAHGVQASIVQAADVMETVLGQTAYDVVCVLQPTGDVGVFPYSIGDAYTAQCYESVLASEEYVANVLDLFASDPYLGIAVPPPPIHAQFFGAFGHEWDSTFHLVDGWLTTAGIDVPRHASKPPVAPIGGSFWFRPQALAQATAALRAAVQGAPSGSPQAVATHQLAVRQLLPLAAQAAGFLACSILPDRVAANQVTNFTHYIREINSRIGGGANEPFSTLMHRLELSAVPSDPGPASSELTYTAYWNTGTGYDEAKSMVGTVRASEASGHEWVAEFVVPTGVTSIRFDPIEGSGCVCRGARVESDADLTITALNAVSAAGMEFFVTDDPQYEITGDFSGASTVRVVLEAFYPMTVSGDVIERLLDEVQDRAVTISLRDTEMPTRNGSRLFRRGRRSTLASVDGELTLTAIE